MAPPDESEAKRDGERGEADKPKEPTVVVTPESETHAFETEEEAVGVEAATDNKDELKAKILAKLEANAEQETGHDSLIGAEIAGRFTVLARIGEGGMGVVYRARQKNMDRDIAIKVLLAEMAANKTVEKRFYLEALAVSKLKHPNTIQIHDFGETDEGQLYIAMEFLDGSGLKEILHSEGVFAPRRAARVAVQILRSLREAHAKGIVHRDLKPDNVFLCTVGDEADFVKVLDFGVAKLKEGDESKATLTKTGAIFGTPRYMSPEQSVSANVDHRSDLYAIGVMLFEMLTGRAPFEAEMPLSLLIMHVQDPVPSFRSVRPDLVIPSELESFTRRLLEKAPDNRYATAEAAIRALEGLIEGMEDFYRNVVTVSDAEKIGIEVASPTPTLSNTLLSSNGARLDATVHSDGTQIIHSDDASPKRRSWLVPALGLALLGGGAIYVGLGQKTADTSDTHEASTSRSSAEEQQEHSKKPAKEQSTDILSSSDEGSVEPAKITLKVLTEPSGATVWEGGTKLGTTPFSVLRVPNESGKEILWRLTHDGYQDKTIRIQGTTNHETSVALVKVPGLRVKNSRTTRAKLPAVKTAVPVNKPKESKEDRTVVTGTPVKVEKKPEAGARKPQQPKKPKDPFEFNKLKETKTLDF